MNNEYDVIVIGAGSGGLTVAVGLVKVGKKVLLVEQEHIGGECTNSGCIPSKALLHCAQNYSKSLKIAGQTEMSENYRQQAFSHVRQTINKVLAEETPEHMAKLGITVVKGEAVFVGRNKITVNSETYTFKKAVIATGSSPRLLDIAGLGTEQILTNQNLYKLEEIPRRLLIIGAGPIGMEMGQALAMLGSEVSLIDTGSRLVKLEDEAISQIITKVFTDLDIDLLLNAKVKRILNNIADIEISDHSGHVTELKQIGFDKVLVAIGRVPNIPKGLKTANVKTTESGVTVDKTWRTSNKNIYALGDVAGKFKFTHVADDTARQVIVHIISRGLFRPKEKLIPKVTFTEPEIGQVGLSWTEAEAEYGKDSIRRIEVPFTVVDRARTDEATDGLLVIVAKRLSGKILGANLIGPRSGEIISTLTLAINNKTSLYRLRSIIFAYPTYSLVLKKADDYFLAEQLANLRTDLLFVCKKIAPKVIVIALWIWGLIFLYSYQQTFGLTPTEFSLKIFKAITSTPLAPLLYILAYTIRPITFFPGTALTILSGIFFGFWGILYTIIGASLSATVAYFVGHFFSQIATNAKKLINGWTDYLDKEPFMAILMMRLTFFPFDLVAYGAGLLRISFVPFLLATMLGTLLGITTFVSIGASISVEEFAKNGITADAINLNFIIISIVIFIVSHVVAEVIKRRKIKNNL